MTPKISVDSIDVSETANPGRRAYVTFLAGNGDYVKGVLGLVKGLRKAKSAYPLVVAMYPDVPEEHRDILRSQGCILREIEPLLPLENQVSYRRAYFIINYGKLRIWNFTEYSKMIYMDADTQVFENIDELFDMPDGFLYATFSCYCAKIWSHIPMHSIGYCQYAPEKVPANMESPLPTPYFSAGMFVFEPNLLTYESLLRTLKVTPATPFAEMDFLNMFFGKVFKPMPPVYHLVLPVLWSDPGLVDPERVKVVHYCIIGSKPWGYTGEEPNMDREDVKMFVKKWWDIYNDESLNLEKP